MEGEEGEWRLEMLAELRARSNSSLTSASQGQLPLRKEESEKPCLNQPTLSQRYCICYFVMEKLAVGKLLTTLA